MSVSTPHDTAATVAFLKEHSTVEKSGKRKLSKPHYMTLAERHGFNKGALESYAHFQNNLVAAMIEVTAEDTAEQVRETIKAGEDPKESKISSTFSATTHNGALETTVNGYKRFKIPFAKDAEGNPVDKWGEKYGDVDVYMDAERHIPKTTFETTAKYIEEAFG